MIIGKIQSQPAFDSAKLVGMTPQCTPVTPSPTHLLCLRYLTQYQSVSSNAFYLNDSPLKMREDISGHIIKNHKEVGNLALIFFFLYFESAVIMNRSYKNSIINVKWACKIQTHKRMLQHSPLMILVHMIFVFCLFGVDSV